MDALVAAPAYHIKLLENDRVRVLHTVIPPGAIVPLQAHRCGGADYLISSSDFIRRDQNGNELADSRYLSRRKPSRVRNGRIHCRGPARSRT